MEMTGSQSCSGSRERGTSPHPLLLPPLGTSHVSAFSNRGRATFTAALLAVFGVACDANESVSPVGPQSSTARSTSELAVDALLDGGISHARWSNSINICFSNQKGLSAADFAIAKSTIFSSLEETWEAHSAIDFTLISDCAYAPAEPPDGAIRINIWPKRGGECYSNESRTRGYCEVGFDIAGSMGAIKRVAVHELGHALGFPHEHQRGVGGAFESPLCAAMQRDLSRWLLVQQQTVSLCFERVPGPHTGGWFPLGAPGCPATHDAFPLGDLGRGLGNLAPKATAPITRFDPYSIMNYCAVETVPQLRQSDDHTLSALDSLGIEILHPYTLNRTTEFDSATFETPLGFVTRGDAKLHTDWGLRGAHESVFGVNSIQWRVDNLSATWGPWMPMTRVLDYGTGPHSIRGTFTDIYFRSQTVAEIPARTYKLDTGLHTALILTATVL